MKESFAKIQAWIKSHPYLAAGIGLVIVIAGYFAVKSSGGNSDGDSSIDGGSLGVNELANDPMGGLSGLGSSAGSMPEVSTNTTPTPSLVSSLPSLDGGGDMGVFDMGIASGYDSFVAPSTSIFSSPASAAAVVNQKPNTMNKPTSTPLVSINPKTPVVAQKAATPKVTTNPVKGLSTITSAAPKVSQAVKPANVIKSISPVKGLSTKSSVSGVKAPPALNKYSGVYPGYSWNGYAYVKR